MEAEARYAIVGIVTMAILLGLCACLLWVARGAQSEAEDLYTIYFRKQSLEGLQTGSLVTMKGIKIGAVDSLEIVPEDISSVRVLIRVKRGTPVRKDTNAVILRNLLTGFASIDLRISAAIDGDYLLVTPAGERYPVITEGTSQFDEVANTIPNFLNQASESVERLNRVLSDKNLDGIERTIENVKKVSVILGESDHDLKSMLKNVNGLAIELSKTSKQVSEVVQNSKGSILNASQKLDAILGNVESLSQTLTEKSSTLLQVTESSAQIATHKIEDVAGTLREANTSLERLSHDIQEFKEQVLYSESGIE